MLELGPPLARAVVDEADEVEPVLRMLDQLSCDELADLARADDHGVLEVEQAAAADPARDRTAERQSAASRERLMPRVPVSKTSTKKSHAPTVTRLKTAASSSAVEWSVRSLSCSSARAASS